MGERLNVVICYRKISSPAEHHVRYVLLLILPGMHGHDYMEMILIVATFHREKNQIAIWKQLAVISHKVSSRAGGTRNRCLIFLLL